MLGLCICYYNYNFGSMLQAYATMKEIERRKIDYRIIRYKKRITPLFVLKNVFRVFNATWRSEKTGPPEKNCGVLIPQYGANVRIRNAAFQSFMQEMFDKKVALYVGYDELQKSADFYGQRTNIRLKRMERLQIPLPLFCMFYERAAAVSSAGQSCIFGRGDRELWYRSSCHISIRYTAK